MIPLKKAAAATQYGYNQNDYQIERSLRFRGASSAYLSRTPSVASNQTTWTWGGWVRRSSFVAGTTYTLFDGSINGTNVCNISFRAGSTDDSFGFVQTVSSTANIRKESTQLIRDPSGWYHLMVVYNSYNNIASDRVKLYVNGSRVLSFSGTNTDPTLGLATYINTAIAHRIGSSTMGTQYFDGYLSEVVFVDGQALLPSAFGYKDQYENKWKPKKYIGTYGTNGFYLPFTDNSALTSGSNVGLGKDFSGNGNYWNTTNVSITAGYTYDSMVDTPTNTYAILNSLLQSSTLTNGGLTCTLGTTYKVVPGSLPFDITTPYGYKWESTCTSGSAIQAGIVRVETLTNPLSNVNQIVTGWVMWHRDGNIYNEGSTVASGTSWASGDNIEWKVKNGALYISKNGTPINSGNPLVTGKTGLWYPFWGNANSGGSDTHNVNFGQRPFTYTLPAGYQTLCTKNLG